MTESRIAASGDELVGRDRELGLLDDAVATIDRQARCIVIAGEVGIGKTALWRAVLDRARGADLTVLSCRPAAEELPAPLLGLVDLLDGFEVAAGALDVETDRFDRGRAVLRTLRDLAAERPVLVAIDDLQWLDPVSAQALRYAVRRLDPEPVLVVATRRSQRDDPAIALAAADQVETIAVGALPRPAIRQLIDRVAPRASRPTRERIFELSGGNPMYAMELARHADRLGDELDRRAPASLADAVSARVGDAPPDVVAVLRASAALGPVSASELERLAGRAGSSAAIAAAIDLDLLSLDEQHLVRVSHPLLASAIVAGSNAADQRSLHESLAARVTDPDARARHLALSCDRPDEAVAAELEAAAARAGRRGAAALAADLAGHSLRLTPADQDRHRVRRSLIGVSHRAAAGETARALEQSDALLALVGHGPGEVDVLTQRVVLDCSQADALLTRAARAAGDDDARLGSVLELHAWTVGTYQGDLPRALELSRQALDLARRSDDEQLLMMASTTFATNSLQAGTPRQDLLDRAVTIAEHHRGPRLGRWPQVFHARHRLWDGHLAEARLGLEAMQDTFARSGTEFQRPYRLLDLARLELAAGNLARAAELTADGLESATDAGNGQAAAWLSYPQGMVAAHRGDTATAAAAAGFMWQWGRDHDERPRLVMAHHVRGLAALTDGDPDAAVEHLTAAVDLLAELGHRHPGSLAALPDAIEATALAGAIEPCARLVDDLADQAAPLGAPWVDAAARRGAGLGALATGEPGAADLLGAAAADFDALGYRLDAARTRLAEGRAHRRAGRRTAAATAFAAAHDAFAELGATPWVHQTELERAPVAPARGTGELTPTEDRIAELVTAGRRNREVAAELFVSVATVEAHLTRIYRKLGVRSRTELTHRFTQAHDPRSPGAGP